MNGCNGVLFLGYKTTAFNKEDLSFAHMLGMHIIQAVSLAETFELLSISEMRYRTLMDCASCGILLHDCRGIIIEMNRHSEEILLNRKEQVIGRDFNDFIDPKDRSSFGAHLHQQLDGETSTFKCQIHRSNGTVYAAEISMVPVKIGNENLFLSVVNSAMLH
jgi:PAS domain S-box-containing protein